MGAKIAEAAAAAGDVEVVARIDAANGFDSRWPDDTEAIIDFSHHAATARFATLAAAARIPFVTGTTGLDAAEQAAVEEAARNIPVVQSANFSQGVNTMLDLVKRAAEILGAEYDIEVVEMHHSQKKDAPSGTALMLAREAAAARNGDLDSLAVFGRHGETGPRPRGEIAIHSLRGGTVTGDHTVVFAGSDERIEITHRAQDRAAFAQGAIRAAKWAMRTPCGLYSMRNVLGLLV